MKKFYLIMGLLTALFFLDKTIATANQRDILLVLDNSGSMHENKPEVITKLIFSDLIAQLHKDDRVGIVIFDESAQLTAPLTLLDNPSAREKLNSSLSQMNFLGQSTNTPAAIERAVYELHNNGRKNSQKSIVFLTDGIIDTGDTHNDASMTKWLIEDLTTECADFGIKIFGVAFTKEADFDLVQALAAKTKGASFRIAEANDISGVFKEIIGLQIPPVNPTPDAQATPAEVEAKPEKSEATSVEADARPVETIVKPVDMTSKQAKPNKNTTAFKIGKNESNSASRPLLQSLSWTFIGILMIVMFSLYIYSVFRQKKRDVMKRASTAPIEKEKPLNCDSKAQLLSINESDTNNSEPPLLFFLGENTITIGRDPKNSVVIAKPTVSSFHAIILYTNGYYKLEDNGSTNGTFVDNRRLATNRSVRLKHDDIVKFATYDFRFITTDSKADNDTVMLNEIL